MAKLPQGYLDKVEALERKFEVISVIFKKYESEFCEVFVLQEKKQTTGPSVGRPRSRKPSRLVMHYVREISTVTVGFFRYMPLCNI